MRMRQRRGMLTARDQPRDMGHVDHQIGADLVRELAERGPVPDPAVGGAAGDDQLGLVLTRAFGDRLHVQQLVLLAHAIADDVEPFARHVHRAAMGQVATRIQVQTHERVTRLQQRQEHRLVHLAAAVRLDIGEFAVEQLLGPLDRQVLDDIDILAATVIAFARISFGVFVGQNRTLRFQHRPADDVLGCDQFDLVALTAQLFLDGVGNVGVAAGQRFGEESGLAGGSVHVLRILSGCGRLKLRSHTATPVWRKAAKRLTPRRVPCAGGLVIGAGASDAAPGPTKGRAPR